MSKYEVSGHEIKENLILGPFKDFTKVTSPENYQLCGMNRRSSTISSNPNREVQLMLRMHFSYRRVTSARYNTHRAVRLVL